MAFTWQLSYPLRWPDGRSRSKHRTRGRFAANSAVARDHLINQLRMLEADQVVITCNMHIAKGGGAWKSIGEAGIDPGVAVWFERKGRQLVMAVDAYEHVSANIRALGLSLEGLRTMERHGANELLDQAFTGFSALPPAVEHQTWWDVLGVKRDSPWDVIKSAREEGLRHWHPDVNDNKDAATRISAQINRAFDEARKERGV